MNKKERQIEIYEALLDIYEGGDGLIGETPESRAEKERIRQKLAELKKTVRPHSLLI